MKGVVENMNQKGAMVEGRTIHKHVKEKIVFLKYSFSKATVKYKYIYIHICIYIYVIMKTMCPPGHHHNGFVATHALGHMMYGYTLLVPMNQRVLNKLSKEHNISGYK